MTSTLPNFIRVIIQNKKGKSLVIFEKKWNCWVFPGGKIEVNETLLEAAKREVFEETNLVIEDLEIVAEKEFFSDELQKNKMGYLIKANKYSEEIKIKELDKISDINLSK